MKLTISKRIEAFEPQEFLEYVRSLRRAPTKQASKAVSGVSLRVGKRIILKMDRAERKITKDEFDLLVMEYGVAAEELWPLLTARKVLIVGAHGEALNEKPKRRRAKANDDRALRGSPAGL